MKQRGDDAGDLIAARKHLPPVYRSSWWTDYSHTHTKAMAYKNIQPYSFKQFRFPTSVTIRILYNFIFNYLQQTT
jgi:hypothetical protein